MPPPVTITVIPTSDQRRGFRQWAGRRGVATLPGNGFAVPVELLSEVPTGLILGARVNGEVYMPAPGRPHHDAPPVDDSAAPDPFLAELKAALADPVDVVAGFPPPPADDIPTTGAPALEDDDSP